MINVGVALNVHLLTLDASDAEGSFTIRAEIVTNWLDKRMKWDSRWQVPRLDLTEYSLLTAERAGRCLVSTDKVLFISKAGH